jgi:acyl-CoA thioesterase-2
MDKSITFTVDRIRDGKSFTTRSVKAIQEGEVIFNCSISFQKREKGLEHQIEMPDVPEPESLKSEQEIREEILKELKMKKEDMPMFIKQGKLRCGQLSTKTILNQKECHHIKILGLKQMALSLMNK